MKFQLIRLLLVCGFMGSMMLQLKAQTFAWAKNFGGHNADYGYGLTVDKSQNICMVGVFRDTADLDPGPGLNTVRSTGNEDIFVTRLDTNGNLLWAVQLGGPNTDIAYAITSDSYNNYYISGFFTGTADFDTGPGTYSLTSLANSGDVFICKLDSNGNLVWARSFGGSNNDYSFSVAVDASQNILITGQFGGTADFDPGPAAFSMTATGGNDMFISKLNKGGNFVWAKKINCNAPSMGLSVTTDSWGNVFTTGQYKGTADFDPGPGLDTLTSKGNETYILKLDSNGNYNWAKRIAGSPNSCGYSIAVDESGFVYVAGGFTLSADFDPGPSTTLLTSSGYKDAYVLKLNNSGAYVWARAYGGPSFNEASTGLAVDVFGNIYTTGAFNGTADFDPGPATYNLSSPGTIYVTKFNALGNFMWAKKTGGQYTADESMLGIAVDKSGNLYTSGYFTASGTFAWPSSATLNSNGGSDAFLAKYAPCATRKSVSISACKNMYSPSGKYIWASSGSYTDTIASPGGCDSIITIQLTLHQPSNANIFVSACKEYRSPSGKYTWINSGIFYDTIPNTTGCDSFITINLTILQSSSTSLNITQCKQLTSPSGRYSWTNSGIFYDTIPNSVGCDSLITINFTIMQVSSSSQSITQCTQLTSPSGKFTWTSSGIYKDTISNIAGCDSIITVNLTIQTLDTSVQQTGNTLTAMAAGASYQWLNCLNGFSPIAGQTAINYTPLVNGSYAVHITQNSCSDTSACYNIQVVGMGAELSNKQFSIYPNPANETLSILCSSNQTYKVKLVDCTGRVFTPVMHKDESTGTLILDTSTQYLGIYQVVVEHENRIVYAQKISILR